MKHLLTLLLGLSSALSHANFMENPAVHLSLPDDYDMSKPPFLYKPEGDQKMNLHFTLAVQDINELRYSGQEKPQIPIMSIPMEFAVTWEDSRLIIDKSGEDRSIVEEYYDKIWIPAFDIPLLQKVYRAHEDLMI